MEINCKESAEMNQSKMSAKGGAATEQRGLRHRSLRLKILILESFRQGGPPPETNVEDWGGDLQPAVAWPTAVDNSQDRR